MKFLALALLIAQTDLEPPEFFTPNEEVRGYILQAIDGSSQHPMLDASMSEYEAGLERITMETALDDPMFQMNYFARSSGGEGRYSVMLAQTVPWPGTLKTRGKKASAEADAKLAVVHAQQNERIADIKKAYSEYAFLAERTRLATAQVDVLTSLEEIVRSRYALGIGGQEDLLRIEMEEAKLQASYDCCALERAAIAGALNAAMGREASEDLPFPQPMELPPPPPPAPVVLARIRLVNPNLSQIDADIEGREHAIALARKKGWPDVTFGISYTDMKDLRNEPRAGAALEAFDATRRLATPGVPTVPLLPQGSSLVDRVRAASEFRAAGVETATQGAMDLNALVELENSFDNVKMKDEVMISVGMNLPIWRGKVKAGIEEARHMKKAAEHDKRRLAVSLEGAAKLAIYGIEDGYRRLRLYDDKLLPQAKRVVETLQGGYASGNTDTGFTEVMTSVQTVLLYEEERAEAIRDIHVAAADLEMLMGGPWGGESPESGAAAPESAAPVETPTPEQPAEHAPAEDAHSPE